MAAIDYGVISLENGVLAKEDPERELVWQGAMGQFSPPDTKVTFYRLGVGQPEDDSKGDPGFYHRFPDKIEAAGKKVLNWSFPSPEGLIPVKTKALSRLVYLSTFFYKGNRYAILQGSDIDLKSFWSDDTRKLVRRFFAFYGKEKGVKPHE